LIDSLETKLDIQELRSKIKDAATSAFSLVRSRHPNQQFCGYALYSDPDAVTVCPSVNTSAHLEKMIATDPDDAEYYRWSPAEWSHEFEGAEYFTEISKALANQVKGIVSSEEHKIFKLKLYECCVSVLESMKNEGFFIDIKDSGVLVFTVSDEINGLECDWIDRLNRIELAEKFRMWVGH
jgi:hypothetical protein